MKELIGDLVLLNGGYVVISTAEDHAQVIHLFCKDEKKRIEEIEVINGLFASGGSAKIRAGKTLFIFLSIYIPEGSNQNALKNHISSTRIIAVKNNETGEYFLIANMSVTLFEMKEFLFEINKQKREKNSILKDPYNLVFAGNRRTANKYKYGEGCEIFFSAGIQIIQLEKD